MNQPDSITPGRIDQLDWRARQQAAATIALGTLASGAGVALLATSGWLISRAAEQPPVLYLLVAVVAVRALGLARAVLRYLERLVGHDLALRLQAKLRLRTYQGLVANSPLGLRRGDLTSRAVADTTAIQDFFVRGVVPLAGAGLVAVTATLASSIFSPLVGIAFALAVVLAAVVVPGSCTIAARRSDAAIARLRGDLAQSVLECSASQTDLVAYDAVPLAVSRIARQHARLARAEQRSAALSGLAAAGQWIAIAGAVITALLVGAAGVAAGEIAPVMLAVLVLTPLALAEVLAGVPVAAQAVTAALAALARVRELADRKIAAPTPGPMTGGQTEAALEVTDLSIGWPQAPLLQQGLSFTVQPGDWVAVRGASGTGKTTLAATLMGLLPPRSGHFATRGSVGYLAQDAHLFDTTVAENVRIGKRDASDSEVAAVLARVRLPLDLDRLVGEHGVALSGGEVRRLALARLLLNTPDLLILDEPTEHLDRPTADAFLADLISTTAECGVLVISHDPQVLNRCSKQLEFS